MREIDINCDMGEGMGNDALIMPFITSANIACGYHAGDAATIWKTIELAIKHNVAVGAHVSYADIEGFGRNEMDISTADIYELVEQQLIIIKELADGFDTKLKHVKPHGALYNRSAKDKEVASAIALAVKHFDPSLILFGLSGSCSISEAADLGLATASEVFADRGYENDGSLAPRSKPGAILLSQDKVAEQVLQMATEGTVTSLAGIRIPVKADTICIHGDGQHAHAFASRVYETLKQANIAIKAP